MPSFRYRTLKSDSVALELRWSSRGRSSAAEHQLPKLRTRVRFSSPAPMKFGSSEVSGVRPRLRVTT